MSATPLILASASAARARLLQAAGLEFTIVPAALDEAAIRATLAGDGSADPEDVAQILCETKAVTVSAKHRDSLVIGGDQILIHDGEILGKPQSVAEAREQLLRLRGQTHRLASAVACASAGQTLWRSIATADLTMRHFSTALLGDYLARMGEQVTETVGGYQIEGIGIQLFERIDGDLFTIQGIPLLPLLTFLRQQGIAAQ